MFIIINFIIASNLHWHAHAVKCLAFTDEGLHLLSGGSEVFYDGEASIIILNNLQGTLVQWSIEQNKKSFIPRLGSAIEHISMDQSGKYIATCMRSNFIQLIDALAQNVVVKTLGISGIIAITNTDNTLTFFIVEKNTLKMMAIDPYSKLLVVSSARGTLQFCDPSSGRANFELDIVSNINALTGVSGELQLPQIRCGTLSSNSSYIATVSKVVNEESLQFWDYDPVTKQYVNPRGSHSLLTFHLRLALNTHLASPHGKSEVHGLTHHPSRDLVVSYGGDANFKFWLRDAESKVCVEF